MSYVVHLIITWPDVHGDRDGMRVGRGSDAGGKFYTTAKRLSSSLITNSGTLELITSFVSPPDFHDRLVICVIR